MTNWSGRAYSRAMPACHATYSLVCRAWNRRHLDVSSTFPELARLPLIGRLVQQ